MKTQELKTRILTEDDMVGISLIILDRVFWLFYEKFSKEHRPFIRANETQENWTKALNFHYGEQMKFLRKELFEIIPERCHKSIMYKNLKEILFEK